MLNIFAITDNLVIITVEQWKYKYFLKMRVKDISENDNLVSMVHFMFHDVLKDIRRKQQNL